MKMKYPIIRLVENPDMKDEMADWFSSKWGIPREAYVESMNDCIEGNTVSQWYVVMDKGVIAGGLGIIENDFHDRKDLTPNVCAVYVEEEYRCQGIAMKLLDYVCKDMKEKEIETLYLITEHTYFYERYGWEFLCMVKGDSQPNMTRMYIHRSYKSQ